jgi:RNA polymerase sigma-70 factor (ECF subfamily)
MIHGDARSAAHRGLEARLRPFVARRVSPSDVDDVLQDVFARIQRGLSDLRDDERFGSWVYQVARSAIAEQRRARTRHPLASDDPLEEAAPQSDGEESSAEQLLARAVVPFIAMLPTPYREALTLTELEGLSQRQAAEMLGISPTAVKSRVQRGRARLRGLLEDCCVIALDVRGRVVECTPRHGRRPPCSC